MCVKKGRVKCLRGSMGCVVSINLESQLRDHPAYFVVMSTKIPYVLLIKTYDALAWESLSNNRLKKEKPSAVRQTNKTTQ